MKRLKKILSLFLALSMVLSITVIPVGATGNFSVSVDEATVQADGTVKVNLRTNNNTGFTSLTVRVFYKPDVLTCTTASYVKNANDAASDWKTFTDSLDPDANESASVQTNKNDTTNLSQDRKDAGWAVASYGYTVMNKAFSQDAIIGSLTFKAAGDVESCETPIEVEIVKATALDNSTLETENSISKITVNGVTPEINEVSLSNDTVTVDGDNNVIINATATSKKGTDLTKAVKWSVSSASGFGVGIDVLSGVITVAKNAEAGTYVITADGLTIHGSSSGGSTTIGGSGGGSGGGSASGGNRPKETTNITKELSTGTASTTLTVKRNPSVATSITIYDDDKELVIPTGENSETTNFDATVRNQYSDRMDSTEGVNVTWSIAPTVKGVMIDASSGDVTVTQDAKDAIENSQEFTVTATSGELSTTAKLTVKRAAAQVSDIELGTVNDMTVPADGATAAEATVTATVKDQYDTQISNPTVEWSITPAVDGVSIDNNGKITVTNAAKNTITDTKQFTVTAKSGDITQTTDVTVKRAASTATSMKVFKGDAELTGDTDTVIIPSTSTDNTYTYSAKVYDQYGSEMSETATISFAATTVTDKVTYDNGTVTVKQGAPKDSTYTLTVSYTGLNSKTITITAKDIDITWPTVSKKTGTYGDKWSDIVKYSGGSAMLNSTKVEGAFELKDASSVPDVGAKYQFVFKSTDGTYTVESDQQTAEIAKKDLTITAGSDSKKYDGQALTKNEFTTDGLVNGDQATVTVTGSATNVADNRANVPSNAVIKNGDAVKTGNYHITYVNGTLTITKAPLTIKANNKTITYGDAAADDGVTYEGLVSSDTTSVVTGLTYEYNYKQYDNVGNYTITPKGAVADNYDITYQSGKLTVGQKEVTLTWSDTGNLYYDGTVKNVTATAGEIVNGDQISVTVVGGQQKEIGTYTAVATALTGEKAGNYKLPIRNTKSYGIEAALTSVTVVPGTVTATIDGLTIKLVGYATDLDSVEVQATGAIVEGNTLTIHDVTYTIDKSGVKTIDSAKVTVKQASVQVTLPEGASSELSAVQNQATTATGLNNALADLIAKAGDTLPEGATKVEVQVILNIQPVSYETNSLKLNIKPQIQYTYKNNVGEAVGEVKTVDVSNSDIKAPITISVNLPSVFAPNFAKHGSEMLPVSTNGTVATWQQSSFSEIELVTDNRKATMIFTFADGSMQTVEYGPEDIGTAFPTDSKDGYTFNGWLIQDGDGTVYTTLTDAALTALDSQTSHGATASFTQKSNNGGNSGSGGSGGTSTSPVSVTTPKNGKVSVDPSNAAKGATVTVTVTPDSGYEMDKLTVTDASGKTIATTDKGNGTFTFTMPNGKVSVNATFKQTAVTPSTGFVDVPASAYYADAVKWAVEQGITTGTSATTFSPEASCTRAQMVTFLWRAAGSPAPKTTTTAFTDLDKSAYYYDAVLWAVEQGITTGTSATTFSPNATVTRGQTVTFLYRFAGQPAASGENGFTDVNSSDYYAAAVQWAKSQGITSGTTATTFSPTNDCTRGQIVTFLYRQLAK